MKLEACFITLLLIFSLHLGHAADDRWNLAPDGGIEWIPGDDTPHFDHIEMSGQQLSVVLRYGVDEKGAFHLNRSIVWPMLRMLPNKTHDNLIKRFALDVSTLILKNNRSLGNETTGRISLNGLMRVESCFSDDALFLERSFSPSTETASYIERYRFRNDGEKVITLEIPEIDIYYNTDPEKGVYGEYIYGIKSSHEGIYELKPGEDLIFYLRFYAHKAGELLPTLDFEEEFAARRRLVDGFWNSLILDTPNPVLNRMFAFAKLRGAESIYKTKGGFMHGPGGESYYAAIWANDQAEYINPLFPFLGYDIGNESALNSFRHFARFMNDDYKPIPSSIISEGVGIWNGAGDRGDGAMIAYGASRYALALGDRDIAEELWPLIEWCLEFCRRKVTPEGVVASDSDELENRFPSGDANLCTSSLYYDALISASYLAKELGKPKSLIITYQEQASELRMAIENYFGDNVEGFETYRYYEGNDTLRSWISIPLTVGIFDRAQETIKALFSPRLWSDDGLLTQAGTSTFWDRSTLYALRGVFAAGATEQGLEYLEKYSRRRLLGDHVPYAIEAWPEGSQRHLSAESGLYARIFTEGIFGIRPTGFRSFELTPRLPDGWDYMNLHSIKAFGDNLSIEIRRTGKNSSGADKLKILVIQDGKTILNKNISTGKTITINY